MLDLYFKLFSGALQHTGDNILNLAKMIANSDELANPNVINFYLKLIREFNVFFLNIVRNHQEILLYSLIFWVCFSFATPRTLVL